ncbi:C39 family peptidase [Patescibacteria group bacterium]|nr:C39 family peptidase [Patescibacteria group bacterium]
MKKKLLLTLILLIILAGFFSYRVKIKNFVIDLTKPSMPTEVEFQQNNNDLQDPKPITDDQTTNTAAYSQAVGYGNNVLPTTYNLNVPFTPQAPFAVWDETFKEACEEAAGLIVHYFYQGKTFTPQIAADEILAMVDWQLNYFGGHFDLTAQQTAEMIKEYLGYDKVEVVDNPTIDEIKNHLFQQRPVIAPAAGRQLGNPYFRTPGPIYHMLVIKGYTEDKFITNDPGTKRGEDFLYDYQVIMEAMHDWNESDILQGEKRIIVIYPN